MTPRVSIQTKDFDVSTELAALQGQDLRVGAVCSFVGCVFFRWVLWCMECDVVLVMELDD